VHFKFFAGGRGHPPVEPATGRVSSPTGTLYRARRFEMQRASDGVKNYKLFFLFLNGYNNLTYCKTDSRDIS